MTVCIRYELNEGIHHGCVSFAKISTPKRFIISQIELSPIP